MFAGSDLKQFYTDRNAGFGVDLGFNAVLFSGKFSFEFSGAMSENRIDSNSYVRGRSYRYTQDDYIKGATPEKLANYLTEDFVNILQTKTASQILDQYGTHVLARYYKGGSLEFNYTYNGKSLSKDNTQQLKAALQASYKGISGGVSGNAAATAESKELEENSLFHYYSYGGKPIDAFSLQELKNSYGDWLNSIADNADICGIGDFNQSLIPLWELAAASGYPSIAKELENEFNARAVRQGKALLVKKIQIERKEFNLENNTVNQTYSFDKVSKNSPASVEIYVLGAGGGGQGGGLKFGTGGAGGGGEVAFVKMSIEEPINFTITLGRGGAGGNWRGANTAIEGGKGNDGERTEVKWSVESSIVANGGKGGGNSETNGGKGGTSGYVKPGNASGSVSYTDKNYTFVSGGDGSTGSIDKDLSSKGGDGAKLEKDKVGNSEDFGGSLGGRREEKSGANIARKAEYGGGGSGGYGQNNGADGGKGFALIKIFYYTLDE